MPPELPLRIGSFTEAREGNTSFWEGRYFQLVTHLLQSEYPETEAYLFENLTPETLAQVDVFILTSNIRSEAEREISDNNSAVLSDAEKAALRGFVEGGGWLVLGVDAVSRGKRSGDERIDTARQLAALFEVDVMREQPIWSLHPVLFDPAGTRVMNEPWGKVEMLHMWHPLALESLDPYARPLALNADGLAIAALIEPGALAPGSGSVLLAETQPLDAAAG